MIIIMLIKRRKKPLFTLWEVNGSSFEQTWIPFTQRYFVPSLVEIGPVVLEKMKMWKDYRQTIDWWTDDGRQVNQRKREIILCLSVPPFPLQNAINIIDIINYINHILYLHRTTCSWSIVSSIYYIPLFISSLSTHVTSI